MTIRTFSSVPVMRELRRIGKYSVILWLSWSARRRLLGFLHQYQQHY